MNAVYPARFEAQPEGGFCVTFPDFSEAITEGDTLEEAVFNASEALTLTLLGRMEEGMEIPDPSDAGGAEIHLIAPHVRVQAALLVRKARRDRTMAEVARSLETSWPAAKRLEDPNHWASLKQLDRALNVLGKKLVLSVE